jgi:AcrR family transcriptional regulator
MRMAARKSTYPALTPADWTKAAFGALARGGVEAIAVEPIAAELGATKGSFYWHFKNREALVTAALDEWERRLTEAVIERLEQRSDPAERLRHLMATAFEIVATDRSAELALLANNDHVGVRRRVRQVVERRVKYMARQLEALGFTPVAALDRALLLSYLYFGYLQMAQVTPSLTTRDARQRHAALGFDSLITVGSAPPENARTLTIRDDAPIPRRG